MAKILINETRGEYRIIVRSEDDELVIRIEEDDSNGMVLNESFYETAIPTLEELAIVVRLAWNMFNSGVKATERKVRKNA